MIIAARGDDETKDLVRSGTDQQESISFGPRSKQLEARIALLSAWLLDDDLHVKRFARRAAATMRELAERMDASLVDGLEE